MSLKSLQAKMGIAADGAFGPGTLKAAMAYYKMTPERAAHFFAQTAHESGIPGASTVDATFAKNICNRCPHRRECAEWGIKNEAHGIWGGLTIRDRQRIRRERGIKIYQEDDVA